MQSENLIPARLFISQHEVEISFLQSLNEYGLVNIIRVEDEDFLEETELEKLERIIRLRYDLNINLEGIDVISHMLLRMQQMQFELMDLKERLRFYETPEKL